MLDGKADDVVTTYVQANLESGRVVVLLDGLWHRRFGGTPLTVRADGSFSTLVP